MANLKSYKEEEQAKEDLVKCMSEITKLQSMRCVVELGIPDIVENHPDGITLADLALEVGCLPEPLGRIMRLLTHYRIFKSITKMDGQDSPTITYTQTTYSRLLTKTKMAPLLMFVTSPELLASQSNLSKFLLSKSSDANAFEMGNGLNVWQHIAANPGFREVFNRAMAGYATVIMSALIENSLEAFEGIGCLVDVGGGNGTTLRTLVNACPSITRAINFDLPHVVSPLVKEGRVEHVGGDMFETIPSADSALLMRVLHDWDDESCVKILKNCMKAIPKETGKVIIVEVVIDDDDNLNLDEEGNNSKHRDVKFVTDIRMLAYTLNGKERTSKEWDRVLKAAGFTKYTIKHIPTQPQSVIEAYP